MTTIVYTNEHADGTSYNTTLAGAFRDIANGTSEIMAQSESGNESAFVGLYLPNHRTFWMTFVGNSTESAWRTGFYRIVDMHEDIHADIANIRNDKRVLNWSDTWHTNGNRHGLIQAYIQAYVNELGENDGYWLEHSTVKY